MRVEHTVTFVSEFDTDKIPASILPAFFALSEQGLIELCKDATRNAIKETGFLDTINSDSSWAVVSVI
jgi:hypothetical protein